MVFSSTVFLFIFLPVVLGTYLLMPRRLRNAQLLAASLFFYAWGEAQYVAVMLVSIASNFFFGLRIERGRDGPGCKRWLVAAVVANLGLLGYFKYANFFVDNLNAVLAAVSVAPIELAPVHLPLGISFFTFQALSYVIDVYRREAPVQRKLVDFGLYVALFPQLIAGPIVRYGHIAKELVQRTVSREGFVEGVSRFIVGFGKKMLIANTLSTVADPVFAAEPTTLTGQAAWIGLLAYTLQVYFDFSGYSDMAIGLGRMTGFTFPENFRYPLIGRSLRDIWSRWHLSMTTWFRDYLYYPLGGSRCSPARAYFNLITVFFMCGLWHGAAWNFIVFGLYHGIFLMLERHPAMSFLDRLPRPLQHVYAMIVWFFGIVLFRTSTIPQAIDFSWAMLGGNAVEVAGSALLVTPMQALAFAAGLVGATPIVPYLREKVARAESGRAGGWPSVVAHACAVGGLLLTLGLSVLQLAGGTANPFIYFRF